MLEIHFRVEGLTDQQQHGQRTRSASLSLGVAAAVLTALVIYAARPPAPLALADAIPPATRTVIVVTDNSGSMAGTEPLLKRDLDAIEARRIPVARYNVPGFGIAVRADGRPTYMLATLETAVTQNPAADVVYLFSDFSYRSEEVDGSNTAGYERLRALLVKRGVRLYLGTVRDEPPRDHVMAARDSGGDTITSR